MNPPEPTPKEYVLRYRSRETGLWHQTEQAAGTIGAIKMDGHTIKRCRGESETAFNRRTFHWMYQLMAKEFPTGPTCPPAGATIVAQSTQTQPMNEAKPSCGFDEASPWNHPSPLPAAQPTVFAPLGYASTTTRPLTAITTQDHALGSWKEVGDTCWVWYPWLNLGHIEEMEGEYMVDTFHPIERDWSSLMSGPDCSSLSTQTADTLEEAKALFLKAHGHTVTY